LKTPCKLKKFPPHHTGAVGVSKKGEEKWQK